MATGSSGWININTATKAGLSDRYAGWKNLLVMIDLFTNLIKYQ